VGKEVYHHLIRGRKGREKARAGGEGKQLKKGDRGTTSQKSSATLAGEKKKEGEKKNLKGRMN